jgi:hypothetical protein
VKKSLTRSVAVTAACAAGLAGALTCAPSAVAETEAPAARKQAATNLTDYGFNATVAGTKILVNGVELRSAKDAFAQQPCTRKVGLVDVAPSLLSVPIENDLIDLSASTSRTETYQRDGRTGVSGINTLAHIALGGELPGGIKTPTLNIDGLVSRADSFVVDATSKFGHEESFTFDGISIGGIDESLIAQVPGLAELLHIVNDLVAPVNEVVDQLVQLLASITGGTIQIPGLGSISLGSAYGKATDRFAYADASALRLLVNPTGEKGKDTLLELGRAHTRISKGVTSGVFNSQAIGLEFLAANDALRMGGINQVSLPCEGTNGRVVTRDIPSVSIGLPPLASVLTLTGVQYRTMGKQLPKGRMRGFVESNLGKLELPVLGLTLEGLQSRVDVVRRPGKPAKRTVSGSVAKITVGSQTWTGPDLRMGQEIQFAGGVITIGKRVKKNYHGAGARMIDISLVDLGSLITLGIAGLYAKPS